MSGTIIGGAPLGWDGNYAGPAGTTTGGTTSIPTDTGGGTAPAAAPLPPAASTAYLFGDNAGLNRLLDNVQATLPGLTLAMLELSAWNTIEEFCIRSTYFREEVEWQLAAGANVLDFNPYTESMSVCWVLRQCGLCRWRVDPPARLVDLDQPTQYRHGRALLALKPTRLATVLPAVLFDLWFEALLDGTLFRLYGQPAKPYSDQKLATYHGGRFRRGISLARDAATRNNSNQQPRWFFPYFARGRRAV